MFLFFFFQAEDGIRDVAVTGVQTCALPISSGSDLYRRGLYTVWKRTVPPPSLTLFDAPDREKCTARRTVDRKSTRLNSSHGYISYAVFCLKKKKIPVYMIHNAHY